MRLVLKILAGLAVLLTLALGTAALVGSRLPVDHSATRSIVLDQPPESVWSAITTYERHGDWRSDIDRIELLPPVNGRPRRREVMNGQSLLLETIESNPHRRLTQRIADTTEGFGGTWTFLLDSTGAGTKVAIVEDGQVYNPVFRFVSHYFMDPGATADQYLRDLGRRFGRDVRPDSTSTVAP